jgi:putative endonuclease
MGELDRREVGQRAEGQAAQLLEASGYRIRARNFTCRYGEVDLVVERGELVCFVEVRMRSSAAWGDPAHTVTFRKQRRVVKAAMHYLFQNDLRERAVRFDVISVVGAGPHARLEHLPGAFEAGE